MNIDEIRQLISQGESEHLEFKKSTTQIKPAFETLCAFLNGAGGIVLIGVTDNGQIVGQQITDKTKQELARELSKIEPKTSPEIHYLNIDENKQIIIIRTSTGTHMPYVYGGRPFERNQSTTEQMSQHRYEQLIVNRGQLNHSWEEFLAKDFTIDDLDHEEIKRTIEEGVNKHRISVEALNYSSEQILINFDLIDHGLLTNAAIALYAKYPSKTLPQCEIKMARFRGLDKLGDFIDNQWLHGNIFQLITAAHHFASRHLPIAGFFEPGKLERIDQPAVPGLALREALINAFCHRDYIDRSSTTSLAIYDDRLEIWNPGKLPHQLKIENLKTFHNSVPRNKTIAQVLYKRGWIESWGTGTLRMAEHCKHNRTPEPEFREEFDGLSVIFSFKDSMHSVSTISKEALSSLQEEIISMLQKAPMSSTQINEHLNKPLSPRTLRHELHRLKQKGMINDRREALSSIWFITKNN
ncbi:ATP-binding protein [Legionella sp. 16cNR16C]|uniref:ATP-binding protein n=1 Tax=Legionella sp. 16cNR16C TaxID=2905656 RepID=UPI001E4EFDE9|nr:ATP-binding protein [Legionella sp. 16cNR16C]MCE3044170.1 putative DNA binding domain-containing protein [Legionella sp. 16cNR16C]